MQYLFRDLEFRSFQVRQGANFGGTCVIEYLRGICSKIPVSRSQSAGV